MNINAAENQEKTLAAKQTEFKSLIIAFHIVHFLCNYNSLNLNHSRSRTCSSVELDVWTCKRTQNTYEGNHIQKNYHGKGFQHIIQPILLFASFPSYTWQFDLPLQLKKKKKQTNKLSATSRRNSI